MSLDGRNEVKVPALGESIREATVSRWLKSIGDRVKVDEVLVELETDKVTLEVNAPTAGILTEVLAEKGQAVFVGEVIGSITQTQTMQQDEKPAMVLQQKREAKTSDLKTIMASMVAPAAQTSVPPIQKAAIVEGFSPAVRKIAEELLINPKELPGTGKGGRVTKEDVLNFAEMVTSEPAVRTSDRREERVKMTRLRQRIAERLKQAQNTAAILTTFNEIDMSVITAIRAEYKESFEKKHGVRLGVMSFFVKACIQALKEFPAVNSEIDGDEIIYKNYYDIGVAVSTPQGLVVPIVRDADMLSFADLEKTIASLALKARDGKLSMAEMTGGSFTISNGGVFGSLLATPILNPPQTGILGMHKIEDRPVAIDKKVEIRPMMYLALSYDHRVIDGRESVSFLVKVKENLENPERLLLDM